MRRFRIVGAGTVAVIAVALAFSGARAQTAPGQQVGKPALLAGLRPPHEHSVHARTAHATIRKSSAKRTRHARMAAEHARHVSVRNMAKNEHHHRERAITASAFAEEPSAQASPNRAPPAGDPAVANSTPPAESGAAPATDTVAAPMPENTSNLDASSNPPAVKVQTVKITSPHQTDAVDLTADHAMPAVATRSNHPALAPPQQAALAAPALQDASAVGSASWIAQMLAALGGAVAAGAVAWFLIGSGAVRTYG